MVRERDAFGCNQRVRDAPAADAWQLSLVSASACTLGKFSTRAVSYICTSSSRTALRSIEILAVRVDRL